MLTYYHVGAVRGPHGAGLRVRGEGGRRDGVGARVVAGAVAHLAVAELPAEAHLRGKGGGEE